MVLEVAVSTRCRRLSCIGRLSVDLRQQQHSAAFCATKQPFLGTALLAPHGDKPRECGLNKACLTPTWLASRGLRAFLPSGKKNESKKKTASLKDRPQRRSALVAGELARLDIDIAALSETRFAEQGSL